MPPEEPTAPLTPQEPTDFERVIQSLDAQKAQQEEEAKHQETVGAVNGSGEKIVQTLQNNTKELTSSIHDLLLATLVSKDPKITQVAKNLSNLLDAITSATDNVKGANFQPLADQLKTLQATLRNIPAQIEAAHKAGDPTPKLEEIATVLGAKNWSPNISVKAPAVDLTKLEKVISDLRDTLKKTSAPTVDNSKVEKRLDNVNEAVMNVTKAINSLSFPSPNYVLPFKDSTGKAVQALVDSSGNLNVNATINTTGLATSALQTTGNTSLSSIDSKLPSLGQTTMASSLPVVIASNQSTLPVVGTGTAGSPGTAVLTVQGIASGTAVPVTISSGTVTAVTNITNWGNIVDNAAFTDGTTRLLPAGYIFDEVAGTALTENDAAAARIDSKRAVIFVGEDATTRGQRWAISAAGALKVDGSAVTQPVSGTFWQATQPVSAASLPLPTLAATSTKQSDGSQKTQLVDGSGNVIGSTTNALDVNIKSGSSSDTQYAEAATTSPGTGNLTLGRYLSTPPSLTTGQMNALQLDSAGNLKVTGSLSVGGTTDNSAFTAGTSTGTPSMAFYHSTIDTVTDGRAAALAIDSKRNLFTSIRDAAGNARGANVTASNELLVSVNNASIAVTGTFWQATQPVSGTVTSNQGTANTIANAWAVKTTDGTNTAAVKAASTGAAATDPALVVGLSPNSPLPTGTNTIGALTANQSVNVAQIGGSAVTVGNGTTAANTQRVTISSDSTGQVAVAASTTATGAAVNSQTAFTNTKVSVKTSAGNLYGYHIFNPGTAVAYVQFFYALTASVTLGTTSPNFVLAIPAGGWADSPATAPGIAFTTGLVVAATSTATGSTAPGSNLVANIWYL